VLRENSWVTQHREMTKAFARRPSLISFGEGGTVKHDGRQPGFFYAVAEAVGPADLSYLRDTGGTHWQTRRDLRVRLVAELPIDDPPQLRAAEIAAMREEVPVGTTGFVGGRDVE
jgi:hypothetical protein